MSIAPNYAQSWNGHDDIETGMKKDSLGFLQYRSPQYSMDIESTSMENPMSNGFLSEPEPEIKWTAVDNFNDVDDGDCCFNMYFDTTTNTLTTSGLVDGNCGFVCHE